MSVRAGRARVRAGRGLTTRRRCTLLGAGEPRESRRRVRQRRPVRHARLSGGARPRLPARGEPAGPRRASRCSATGFWQRVFGGDAGVLGRVDHASAARRTRSSACLAPSRQLPDDRRRVSCRSSSTTRPSTPPRRKPRRSRIPGRDRPRAGRTSTPDAIDADLKRVGAQLQTAFPRPTAA